MNKGTVLEYPKLDSEVITVENFMVIKKAKMKCGDITVLVGEQATGKSLLAKLRYFFWKYQQELINENDFLFQDIPVVKRIKEYNKSKVEDFCELFPDIEMEDAFLTCFQNGEISITIKRDKKSSEIKIEHSKGLKDIIKRAEEAFDWFYSQYGNEFDLGDAFSTRKAIAPEKIWLFRERIDFNSIPYTFYVPASRLFFATVQDNIFRLIASGEYSLDPIIKQFSRFWEKYRIYFSNEFKNPKKEKKAWFKQANKILDGDYLHENKIDYIKNNWGRTVKLRDASSGQQDVLPLLAAINDIPKEERKNQLLIIEEPEAHIYPTSQRVLMKMIAVLAREQNCKVMITTHSPYVPTCLNNEILISQNKDRPLAVTAHYISKGKAQDIYDKEDDLIDTNQLDSASGEIMNEYFKALEEYDARTEGKDKNGE